MRLNDRVAIVTGAGRGIGRSIAIGLAKEGAHIVIAEIDQQSGSLVSDEIKRLGRETIFIKTDVSQKVDIDKMVKETITKFDKIDILINNAAIAIYKPLLEISEEILEKTIRTNLMGPFFCTQSVVREMIKYKKGKIINISSISAEVGDEGAIPYCMAKGGIKMLTKTAALELAPYHINVNAIAPGFIETGLGGFYDSPEAKVFLQRIPWGRWGKSDELIGTVIFLASDESDYITGSTILVDGGFLSH